VWHQKPGGHRHGRGHRTAVFITEAFTSDFVQKPCNWVSDTECHSAAEHLKQQKQMHEKLIIKL